MDEEMCESVPDLETERRGGPQGEDDEEEDVSEEQKKKAEEREKKKAEVRKRLEAERAGKKAKKGFLTPERKKKLRKMLNVKAAEEMKAQAAKREAERTNALKSRIIALPDVDNMQNQDELKKVAENLYQHLMKLEAERYDIYAQVAVKEAEINEMTIAVCELRGKYVRPALKKVSKYDNKFKKMLKKQEKESDYSEFRQNLKKSEKKAIDELTKKKQSEDPEWARKKKEEFQTQAESAPRAPREPKPPKAEGEAEGEAPAAEAAPAEVAAEA